eukprot:13373072-Ditylum_brightwellii.AAC.1
MKSAYEWCKEGVFRVLGKEDRASSKDGLLLSANEGERGREVMASFEEKPVFLGSSMLNGMMWVIAVLGKEDKASGKDSLLLSANEGEGGREDRASFEEKPVSLGSSMLNGMRKSNCRWEDRSSFEEKPVSHFKVLGKEDRASSKCGLSASEGEGGRKDRASFEEKPVSHFGESRMEDRTSYNKKPVSSAGSWLS